MERLSYIELAGRQCPLNFSLGAVEEIGRRYGSLEGMQEAFSAFDEKPIHEALGDILWILAVLLRQGAEYCRVMEGREEEPFTEEQLKCLLGAQDAGRITEALTEAMQLGQGREVEVQADPKNGEAAQGR